MARETTKRKPARRFLLVYPRIHGMQAGAFGVAGQNRGASILLMTKAEAREAGKDDGATIFEVVPAKLSKPKPKKATKKKAKTGAVRRN